MRVKHWEKISFITGYSDYFLNYAMSSLFFAILFSSIVMNGWAQSTQPCIVKQYNQKKPKTPLAGVEVMASNAGSTVSASDGRLTLSFRTLKPGDKVKLISAKKAGFEIFNSEAVEQWNISRNSTPFTLVLVKSEYFSQLKGKLTQTSTDSYKSKYQQAIRELELQKKGGKLMEEEYNKKYDELEERYHDQLKNLDNYIDQFARIDMSDISAEEQHILDMVQEGRIDEAVKAYETLDISGKLRQAHENLKALSAARARIEEEESHQSQAIEELKAKLEREISTLKLAGGKENYDKIGRMLKEIVLSDTTNIDAVLEYAKFTDLQHNYKESLQSYLICLHNCSPDQLSYFQHMIGSIYFIRKLYDKAKEYFLLTLETARHNNDREMEATASQDLGTIFYVYYTHIYEYYNKFDIVEKYWDDAMNIWKELYKNTPNIDNLDKIANMEIKMGMLYTTLENYSIAENSFMLAKDHYELLASQKPEKYQEDLADIYKRLGDYYVFRADKVKTPSEHNQFKSLAEKQYLSALAIFTQLFNQNPDFHRTDLASINAKLGGFYYNLQNYEKAKCYFSECLNNYSILYQNNPDRYCINYGIALRNLGLTYGQIENRLEAEKQLFAALELFAAKYYQDPESADYHKKLIDHINTLISFYKHLNNSEKTEKYYNELIRIEEERFIAKDSSELFLNNYKEAISNFGIYYLQNDKITEGIKLYERLHQIDSGESINWNIGIYYYNAASKFFEDDNMLKAEKNYLAALDYFYIFLKEEGGGTHEKSTTSDTMHKLGIIYHNQQDYTKAENYYLKALNIYFQLSEINPCYGDYLAKVQHNLGNLYKDTHDYANAEKYYLNALENKKKLFNEKYDSDRANLALTQRCMADLYNDAKDYTKAEKFYIQALGNYNILFENQPDDYRARLAWVQYCLMHIYTKEKSKIDQYDTMLYAALANYEILFRNNSSYQSKIVDLRNRKGWRFINKGNLDEAMQLFDSTYKLNPEKSAFYLAVGYNAKAYEYAKVKDYVKAIETIDKSISLQPKEANFYDSKGEILLMKGDEKEALEMWQKVIEIDSDFLSKHNGETELHRQLKEKGFVE